MTWWKVVSTSWRSRCGLRADAPFTAWPLALVVLVALWPAVAHAQDDAPDGGGIADVEEAEEATAGGEFDELAEMDLEDLLGVVVSVSQRAESLFTAPATVTVLDHDDIRASDARTIPELLRAVPGVQVLESSPGNSVVALRGMGALTGNNVVVLLDGVPLNNPLDGEVDWSTIPVAIDDIERIEVVRGPVSAIYGANAYTGLIRIDSRAAPAEGHTRSGVRAIGGLDTDGAPYSHLSAFNSGRRGGLSAATRGQLTLDGTFAEGMPATQPSLRSMGLGTRMRLDLNPHTAITLDAGGALSERAALDYLVRGAGPQVSSRVYGRAALLWTDLSPAVESVSLWGSGRWLERRSQDASFMGFHYEETRSVVGQYGMDASFALPGAIKLSLGADGGAVRVTAPFLHPQENGVPRGQYGAHISASIDIGEMVDLAAAARVDLSPFADGPQLSVRGSAAYHKSNFSIRLVGASAYRNPTYVEVAGQFRDPSTHLILLEGSAGLSVPRLESFELSIAGAVGGRLTVLASAYGLRAHNLVVGDFTRLTRKTFRTDTGEAIMAGAEVEIEWRVSDRVTLLASGAGIGFLSDPADSAVTVGVESHNSILTAGLDLRTNVPSARLTFTAGALFFSARRFDVRVGIPPELVTRDVPHAVRLHGSVTWRPVASFPLDLRLSAISYQPQPLVESPLRSAGALGTRVLLGVELANE